MLHISFKGNQHGAVTMGRDTTRRRTRRDNNKGGGGTSYPSPKWFILFFISAILYYSMRSHVTDTLIAFPQVHRWHTAAWSLTRLYALSPQTLCRTRRGHRLSHWRAAPGLSQYQYFARFGEGFLGSRPWFDASLLRFGNSETECWQAQRFRRVVLQI